VAIGATAVGSIVLTVKEGQTVRKGQELGYFAFGGSTCILLIPKERVNLDSDILRMSSKCAPLLCPARRLSLHCFCIMPAC
jgi:phosphatidylserine decarboxylase